MEAYCPRVLQDTLRVRKPLQSKRQKLSSVCNNEDRPSQAECDAELEYDIARTGSIPREHAANEIGFAQPFPNLPWQALAWWWQPIRAINPNSQIGQNSTKGAGID
jgi:hypothetical protein